MELFILILIAVALTGNFIALFMSMLLNASQNFLSVLMFKFVPFLTSVATIAYIVINLLTS